MVKEICSSISRPGSKVGSNQPKSPGAFSNPSRASGARFDSVFSAQPSHAHVSLSEAGQPAEVTIVGPRPGGLIMLGHAPPRLSAFGPAMFLGFLGSSVNSKVFQLCACFQLFPQPPWLCPSSCPRVA